MQWFNPWYLHWTMNQNGLGSLLKWPLPRHLLLGDSDSVGMSWSTAVIFNKCPGDSNTASSDWCAISTGLGYLTSLLLKSIIHCFCLGFFSFWLWKLLTHTQEKRTMNPLRHQSVSKAINFLPSCFSMLFEKPFDFYWMLFNSATALAAFELSCLQDVGGWNPSLLNLR